MARTWKARGHYPIRKDGAPAAQSNGLREPQTADVTLTLTPSSFWHSTFYSSSPASTSCLPPHSRTIARPPTLSAQQQHATAHAPKPAAGGVSDGGIEARFFGERTTLACKHYRLSSPLPSYTSPASA